MVGNDVGAILVVLGIIVLAVTLLGTLIWFLYVLFTGFRRGRHV